MDKFILFHTRDNWFSWNSWKRYLKLSFSKFLIKSSKIKLINDYCQWMSICFYYKSHVLYYIRRYNISVSPKFSNFLLYKMNIIFWKIVKFISNLICQSKIVNLRLCEQNLFIYFSYDNNLSLEHLLSFIIYFAYDIYQPFENLFLFFLPQHVVVVIIFYYFWNAFFEPLNTQLLQELYHTDFLNLSLQQQNFVNIVTNEMLLKDTGVWFIINIIIYHGFQPFG